MTLDTQTCVVTGASRGSGRTVAGPVPGSSTDHILAGNGGMGW